MKFCLTFKTPDVVDEQQLKEDIALSCAGPDVGPDEDCDYCNEKLEEQKTLIDQFVKYGEVVVIEFDTVNKTATVVKVDE